MVYRPFGEDRSTLGELMHDEKRARGLRVLIVGASSGIGRELASQLAAQGVRVAACARRRQRIEEIPGVSALECDVQDPVQCRTVVAEACDVLGGLDVLVYVAGLTRITPLDQAGFNDWLEIFATNIFGAAMVTKAALPHLTSRKSQGRALFLTSDAADLAMPGLVAYAASKSSLGRFCQGLAAEFPSLKVSEIVVGPTAGTELVDQIQPDEFVTWASRWFEEGFIRHGMLQSPDVARTVVETILSDSPPPRVLAAGPEEETATSLDEGRRQAQGS
jgi:NAD(P)-dependent dehydrogenase (short-subunit alcohol dehydrogenase family)